MEQLSSLPRFQEERNIVLEGFDPVAAGGFTQIPNVLLKDPALSAQAKLAYALLLSYAWHNDKVFPGQDRMSADAGTSRPTMTRAIGELEDHGWLDITRRGQGKTNVYILKHTVTPKHRKR